jgi:DNA-binding transcriptional MerR regulator/effector-binding domain-containing protein
MEKSQLISITEYARLRGVTTETLRQYDRIGLLKPEYIDPDSRVRYYSLAFADEKLGTIIQLRQLDMSLAEIKDFFEGRNLKKSLDILKEQETKLKHKINELNGISVTLNNRIQGIEEYLGKAYDYNRIEIKEIEKRSIILCEDSFTANEELKINLNAIMLENELSEIAPLIGGGRFALTVKDSDDIATESDLKFRVGIIVDKFNGSKDMTSIDKGAYVSKMRYGQPFEILDDLKTMKAYCNSCGYKIIGDAIELLVVDMCITDVPEENIYELQIPVKSNK